MPFLEELKRRNVFRVGVAYAVAAWVILQILDVVGGILELPAWAGKLILALLVVGFVVSIFVAWAYELTPDGIKRDSEVARGESIAAKTGQKLNLAIIVFLTLAVALLLVDKFMDADTEATSTASTPGTIASSPDEQTIIQSTGKSVAVLPFDNRSPRQEDVFFTDGMHDELLTRLSKVSDLLVISRTSVMAYRDSEQTIPDIARELGVAAIMEGSVQRAGNRVRINVQLIDAQSDTHLWAEIYDSELTVENIFDIQSEITHSIATAMNSALSDPDEVSLEALPTKSLAAYDAYVAGKLLFNRVSPDGFRQAIDLFDTAIEEDPDFAAAWSAQAEAILELYWLFDVGNLALIEQARQALDQAEALDPDAIETHSAMGHFYYFGMLEYERAVNAFDRVLARAPNHARAWAGKGFALRRAGRFEEAIVALERALSLDPLALDPMDGVIETNALLGRFESARKILVTMREVAPTSENTLDTADVLNFRMGKTQLRWENFDNPVTEPRLVYFLGRYYAAMWTRNAENINFAGDNWPEQFRGPDRFPELYNIKRAEALLILGRHDEARILMNEIKSRLDALEEPYPVGWRANARYLPVDLPGMMGDLEEVNAVVTAYEADPPADQYSRVVDHFWSIAKAYALAGDFESALTYLERQIENLGAHIYLPISAEPAFDALRDHPRYLAIKASYLESQ